MKSAKSIESVLHAEDEQTRLIERPDGFYWQNKLTEKLYGPFATLDAATEDAELSAGSDYEEGESLQEAEDELGLSSWVDPDTGELAEGAIPHLNE